MEKTLYGLNYSQEIVLLQSKYSLFKRVLNILFKISLKEGFDRSLMTQAINLVMQRNDCMRIRFVKDGKTTEQYFEENRSIGEIPCKSFDSVAAMERFILRFRRSATNPYKGKVLEVVYCTDPSGKDFILFKICHLCADTYGIGILVQDLLSVYEALKSGSELPATPGSFEEILRKEAQYRDGSEARERDLEYFRDYFANLHPDAPMYCGINGDENDDFLKQKHKGQIGIPYRMVTCDTSGFKFDVPESVASAAIDFCGKHGVTPTGLFMYAYSVATSMVNDRAPYQIPLILLNCRATLADRKAAGTKVQSMSVYTTVDWEKSFLDNILKMQEEQNELFRHTRLSYLEVEALLHKQYNLSMLAQATNFCFSFIPMAVPEGVEFQILSNGKGALICYLALLFNPATNAISIAYDIQTKMITPVQLVEFHNKLIRVLETVMKEPEKKLSQIL